MARVGRTDGPAGGKSWSRSWPWREGDRKIRPAMKFLVTVIGLSITGALGCHLIKADEPKQRQDWTASPMRYGDTQFEGLRTPGWQGGMDGGVE